MFFPENVYQYTWVAAPLVSLLIVLVASLLANRISFGSILANALVKVIVHAPIFFALKMSYLMYRAWPFYIKQTTTPSVGDFIVRRAPDVAPSVAASAAFLFVVALVANAIAHGDRARNVWVTGLVFALAYGAFVYGVRTYPGLGMLVDAFF